MSLAGFYVSVLIFLVLVSQEMQKSFDEKNTQMLQEAMTKLHPEVGGHVTSALS